MSFVPGTKNLLSYRRPSLEFAAVTQVEPQKVLTGVSGEVAILFPDGDYRIDSTTSHTDFLITRNAVLSGTALSGLRTSLSEATNTWYAIYAVKVTDSSTDFVTVGDTVLPLPTNFATLNSNFGTNGWVYLGLIRNGDNSGATGDIINFIQSGGETVFANIETSIAGAGGTGLRLAASGTSPVTYTYSPGTGTAQIPNNIKIGSFWCAVSNGGASDEVVASNSANSLRYFGASVISGNRTVQTFRIAPSIVSTIRLSAASPGTGLDINLHGWVDTVLGTGSNPLF